MLSDILPASWPLWFVFGLLLASVVLFATELLKMDMVALLVMLALAASGIITPDEAVAGFGASIVVTIAALFVVGEGLFRSGVAASVGAWILRVGGRNEWRLLMLLMPVVALLSAFMSSTGAVALFIPVVLSIARRASMSVPRLMLPLAFAALIGGMITLIGTPPNIIASGLLESAGHAPFGFFDFTPLGVLILLAGMAYLPFAVKRLIPAGEVRDPDNPHPRLDDFAAKYGIADKLHRLHLLDDSPLIGLNVVEAGMRTKYDVTVFGIDRHGKVLSALMPVLAETRFQKGDALLVYGSPERIDRICASLHLEREEFTDTDMHRMRNEFGMAEVTLRPTSLQLGQTIKAGRFRQRFNLSVVGVRRGKAPLDTGFNSLPLEYGDTLLLVGGWRYIKRLEKIRDFVIIETPAEMEDVPTRSQSAPVALAILVAMVVVMVCGWLPSVTATLCAALAMVLTGCVRLEEAYRSLSARSLVLIAGMLPLATAMQKTGAITLICNQVVVLLGDSSALVLAGGFFLLTSILTQVMSNTATTLLVAPIALGAATTLQLHPAPLMMCVAIGASTAFVTPIASPVNTLVVAPGNYRFVDFVRVGLPMQLIAMLITLLVVPWLFPF